MGVTSNEGLNCVGTLGDADGGEKRLTLSLASIQVSIAWLGAISMTLRKPTTH